MALQSVLPRSPKMDQLNELIQHKNIIMYVNVIAGFQLYAQFTDKNIPKTGLLHLVHTAALRLHLQSVYLKVLEVGAAISIG